MNIPESSKASARCSTNPEFVLVQHSKQDTPIKFRCPYCNYECSKSVHKESLERGVVVGRCFGCKKLLAVADHSSINLFLDGTQRIEKFFKGLGIDMPTHCNFSSFCATFETLGNAKTFDGDHRTWYDWAIKVKNEGDTVVFVPKNQRDQSVSYTHPTCRAHMVRMVSRDAHNRGIVVARCTSCHELVAVADRISWFGVGGLQSKLGSFLGSFRQELKKGSEDAFCVTAESTEAWFKRNV